MSSVAISAGITPNVETAGIKKTGIVPGAVFEGTSGFAVTESMRADIRVASAPGAGPVGGTVYKLEKSPNGQRENNDLFKGNVLQNQISLNRGLKEKS